MFEREKSMVFSPEYEQLTPVGVAGKAVSETLKMQAETGRSVVLAFGEEHFQSFSHQLSQVLTLKKLSELGEDITLSIEFPSNILEACFCKFGGNAASLVKHFTSADQMGHFVAKSIISRAGTTFGQGVLLQAAINHNVRVTFDDAPRLFSARVGLDASDAEDHKKKEEVQSSARKGMDDRNRYRVGKIQKELKKSLKIVQVSAGSRHLFGGKFPSYDCLPYEESLSSRFKEANMNVVVVDMYAGKTLPLNYKGGKERQKHIFLSPQGNPTCFLTALEEVGLDIEGYDPRRFRGVYRDEVNVAIKNAERELGM